MTLPFGTSKLVKFSTNFPSKPPELGPWIQISAMNKPMVSSCSHFSPRLVIFLLSLSIVIFISLQIRVLHTPPTWPFVSQWEKIVTNSCLPTPHDTTSKLREAVTFLPLKDLRYANVPMKGHTWFMSSMYDFHEEGEVQYQKFPSKASGDRVLCLKGRDRHDGSWNSYALAWPDTLPENATLMKGITFVSYNHYDYANIWHSMSALMPFVAWHIKSQCAVPRRWILYHWGELRMGVSPWVETILEATFGTPLNIEKFNDVPVNGSEVQDSATCFEEAVVMRHNEGGMSREKRMQVYDLMRCRSRMFCNVSSDNNDSRIGMTLLMRDGPRSFKNASSVISLFEDECQKVEGCQLMVAYPGNLSFCDQVKLMRLTDVVISPHGAQMSNMILMDRDSSVMEFYPKGWLEVAGVGQYVYRWLASWSGMLHQGAWRDPDGDQCPFPENDRRCMSVFKNAKIGHNETYFREWARNVLNGIKIRKARGVQRNPVSGLCGCNS